MLGNGRLEAQCFDGEKRLAHIRGKMRKKVWINQGDIILISLREFQDDKADVIVKYTVEEVSNRSCDRSRPTWLTANGLIGAKLEAVWRTPRHDKDQRTGRRVRWRRR